MERNEIRKEIAREIFTKLEKIAKKSKKNPYYMAILFTDYNPLKKEYLQGD